MCVTLLHETCEVCDTALVVGIAEIEVALTHAEVYFECVGCNVNILTCILTINAVGHKYGQQTSINIM